jgi:hypothetical protein
MIKHVYITRINNEPGKKQYGFGVTTENENVYIPGFVVDNFDLSEDDVGTKNMMSVMDDDKDKTDYVVTALLVEDSALQAAYEWQKSEIERLHGILDQRGIDY